MADHARGLWHEIVSEIGEAGTLFDRIDNPDDPRLSLETIQLLIASLAAGHSMLLHQDADTPELVPFLSPLIPCAAPNPDYLYRVAWLDDRGTYRLRGRRGTSLFAHVGFGQRLVGTADQPSPSLGGFDLDSCGIDEHGWFDVTLSAVRPIMTGQCWQPIPSGATYLSIREASYDWLAEESASFAIERTDRIGGARRLAEAELAERLKLLAAYPRRFAALWLGFVAKLRAEGIVNRLRANRWEDAGGLPSQHYYEGIFELDGDSVLLVETDLPRNVRYWSILVTDSLFNTVDWVNGQTSINGCQAHIDTDGRFRAVIAAHDPGVPNWLDTGGRRSGVIQGRWFQASEHPLPTIRRVTRDALRAALPADTPVVSAEQRDAMLRTRRLGAQLRRKW